MRRAALLPCLLLLAPLAHAPGGEAPARAAELLALARAAHADPLRDAVRIAELAAPGAPVPAPRHASAALAVQALLAARGVGVAADASQLDALPPRTGQALAGVVDAFLAFDAARSPGARAMLLDAMLGLRDALRGEAAPPLRLALPPAFALDLAGGDDAYTQDVALLLDAGGNDTYLNNAGGSNVLGSDACVIPPVGHAAALLDLGGDDAYRAGPAATNGGGSTGGSGFLLDAAGNDGYVATHIGVNGGGWLGGTGLLLDAAGDDHYQACCLGANGGGAEGLPPQGLPGAGLLVDGGGHDAYSDAQGGSGSDVTVAPKGYAGAQLDLQP